MRNLNDLPVPMNSKEAALIGRRFGRSLLKISLKSHPELPKSLPGVGTFWAKTGERVGMEIYRECAPWTIDEFHARFLTAAKLDLGLSD